MTILQDACCFFDDSTTFFRFSGNDLFNSPLSDDRKGVTRQACVHEQIKDILQATWFFI